MPPKAEKPPKEAAPKPEKAKKEPKEKKPKPAKEAPVASSTNGLGSTIEIRRQRPIEKTPLMIGGGAIIAGAGALYYLSYQARQDFSVAKSSDEIDRFYSKTNNLFLLSAGVFAVGAGTMTWGVILDSNNTPLPNVQFRF